VNPYHPEEVLERFASYASDTLAKHLGRVAYLWISDAFRDLNTLLRMHAVMVVRENPPKTIVDRKGRVWELKKVIYVRSGGSRYKFKNRIVYGRLT